MVDRIELTEDTAQELEAFCELLQKDRSEIIQIALQDFFEKQRERLMQEDLNNHHLDYEEFWDGVDID
jgi:metal-responsive CopG/Arc/MetJ family transcriptional regulator